MYTQHIVGVGDNRTGTVGSYFGKAKKREICALEMEFVNSLVPARGSLLDVGSGAGTFVEVAFECGWDAYGVDPAGPEIEESAEGRVLRLFSGTLADLKKDARFDVVTMWDVVEHLERPLELIVECKDRIVPGGWLVIETGNFHSTGRVLGGKEWWGYQHDHRWYFSPGTLQKLLRSAGCVNFRLCERTLRPWVKKAGNFEGPSKLSYLLATAKRPWKTFKNIDEFKRLSALRRRYPDSANLQIFTLAAQFKI